MRNFYLIILAIMLGSMGCWGQNFVYKPKNPAFGGDTFNYQWLQSSAEAQNKFTEEDGNGLGRDASSIDQFADNLNNQFLGQVSRSLYTDTFGENGLSEGVYNYGDLLVDIYPSTEGLTINILDTTSGEQTQVIIPSL